MVDGSGPAHGLRRFGRSIYSERGMTDRMNEQDLEDVYCLLADRLTAAGDDYPAVLSRLVLLMMNHIGMRDQLVAFIDEAAAPAAAMPAS